MFAHFSSTQSNKAVIMASTTLIKPTAPASVFSRLKPSATLIRSVLCIPALLSLSLGSLRAETALTADSVMAAMKKVEAWQLANPSKHSATHWTQGAYYTGVMALYGVSRDQTYLNAMRAMGETNQWKLGPKPYHADDHAVGQTYCVL